MDEVTVLTSCQAAIELKLILVLTLVVFALAATARVVDTVHPVPAVQLSKDDVNSAALKLGAHSKTPCPLGFESRFCPNWSCDHDIGNLSCDPAGDE